MATSKSASSPPSKLESIQKALHKFLHTRSAVTPVFELIEKHAKLKREYVFVGESRHSWCVFTELPPTCSEQW